MHAVRHSLSVSTAPEAALQAVTTMEGIRGWWCQNSAIATAVGGPIQLNFVKDGQAAPMRFRLDALEDGAEGASVRWTCVENVNPIWVGSTLTWTVAPEGAGARIEFTHDKFAGGGPPFEATAEGWKYFVGSLKAYLETGAGTPW